MKHVSGILFIMILLGLPSFLMAQDTQTVAEDGIELTVSTLPNEIDGFKTFLVRLTSKRSTDHSVQLEISLNDRYVKEPEGARGQCTVMVGLHGGETLEEKKQCKETAPSNSFSVKIKKIFSRIY